MAIPRAYDFAAESAGFFNNIDMRELALRKTLVAVLPGESKWQRSLADGATILGSKSASHI